MNNELSLKTAIEQQQAGKLDEAEHAYREILQSEPENADVLHFLGILLFQKKDNDSALAMIKKAIQINPGNANAYYNLAGILQDIGELDEALTYYQKVIEINPDVADTYNSIGAVLQKKGQLDDAITHFRKALQMNPQLAVTQLNLGYALHQKGQLDEAITCYQKAIEINPEFDDAYYNLGVIFQAQGRLDEALVNYYSTMHHNPDKVDVHNNVGIILKAMWQLDGAVASFRNALGINPDIPEIWSNLGNALHDKGEIIEAIKAYQGALKLNPDMFQTHYDMGNALKEEGKTEEAISAYDRAIELKPGLFKASWARCMALLPVIYNNEQDIGRTRDLYREELLKLQERLSLQTPDDVDAAAEAVGSQQPFYLAAQGFNDKELQKIYGAMVCKIMAAKYPQWAVNPSLSPTPDGEPIRVGIVSGYFYRHSNWKLPIKGWVENLDRKRFSLHGYYTGREKDKETDAARACFSRFVEDVFSFEKLCETIRNDNLHILIFPEIGMNPISLRLASLRLAPVQCNSWGHPDTSGLPTIDYYLSSELMEPPDGDNHYTEHLIRLPNLSVYYTPLEIPETESKRASFNLREESAVYLCCHALFTHLPQYDEIYTRIARQAGDCQFVFIAHESEPITEKFRTRMRTAFETSGLDADRYLVFLPILDPSKYHSLNCLADVFLDTIGWSGGNSTFEALACNLPVVTLPGEFMRGRHCSSILRMMGLTETIAGSLDEYVELAVRIGKDSGFRRSISDKIAADKHLIYQDQTCITALEEFIKKVVREKL
ncbi:MAG: tetratricopeptide repeat protein [Thermodesulfovibrionales bacterium]